MPALRANPCTRDCSSVSARERVYRSLKGDIVKGVLGMGQRLSESQLAAKYGVSKTPAREALALLQQEGLVEVVPRVGYLTSRVTLQDVDDIFNLRKIVESAAAERAATGIAAETLERLEQLCSGYRPGDRESYLLFLEENLEFHRTIAEAAGNRRLVDVVVRLLEQMQRLIILRLGPRTTSDELVEQHRHILDALRQRDPVRARDFVLADITSTHQAALNSIRKLMARRHI